MTEAAAARLSAAVALEQTAPVNNWGTVMERFQGADRRWVEEARYASN